MRSSSLLAAAIEVHLPASVSRLVLIVLVAIGLGLRAVWTAMGG
jgi:Flp pilus assembly pilin Flp